MPLRILLVDDHIAVRRGLETLLQAEFPDPLFGAADNGASALDLATKQTWDVAILDLNLPGRGGIDLISTLKAERPRMGLLVYSMNPEDQFGVRSIQAGADGYLTKDSDPEEIFRAVKKISGGGRYISANLGEKLADRLMGPSSDDATAILSDREFEVLRKLASARTATQIAEELSLSVKTISTYRTRILQKLRLSTTADIIRYALDRQLVH